MISLTSRPSGVAARTASRSSAPVEMCGIPQVRARRTACVPLPAPGGPNITRFRSSALPRLLEDLCAAECLDVRPRFRERGEAAVDGNDLINVEAKTLDD